jgi:hypothetical protein
MDKTVLVERDLMEGKRLIEALDQERFPLTAALWLFLPDLGVWRLVLGSPAVDQEGPRHAYTAVQSVLDKLRPPVSIDLDDISVAADQSRLIADLRIFSGTDGKPFIGGISLSKAVVGDSYVENAYIYRAERIIGVSGDLKFVFAIPHHGEHGRKWSKAEGVVVVKDGAFVDVHIPDHPLRHSRSRNGITSAFYVFSKVEAEGDKLYGDVQRFTVQDGRLRSVEEIASHVEIAA